MARQKRLTREVPARGGPIRNAMAGERGRDAQFDGARFTLTDVVNQSLRATERLTATADTAVKGAVEHGVETAYMVIEEYMRRGQDAASRYGYPTERPYMNDDQYRYGWNVPPGPVGPLMVPWVSWLQMVRLWSDAITAFTVGGAPGAEYWSRLFGGYITGTHPKIELEVSSQLPIEVRVAIEPGAESCKLTPDPLDHTEGTDTPITGARLDTSRDLVRVVLTVPNGKQPGRYRGALKDDRGTRRGELVVTVKPPPEPQAAARTRRPRARKTA